MPDVPCFWLEPIAVARELYASSDSYDSAKPVEPCPVLGTPWHRAAVGVERLPYALDDEGCLPYRGGDVTLVGKQNGIALDDPRFPTTCACGHALTRRGIGHDTIYRADDGREFIGFDSAPAGAMCRATWNERFVGKGWPEYRLGPDGMCLVLKLPDGSTWELDRKSGNGGFWTRTGTAPNITARPSILSPGNTYHGWLTDGVLRPC